MSCEEIKAFLDEYICGELDEEQSKMIKAHLDTCDDCRAEYVKLKALKEDLADLSQPVPQDFKDRFLRRLRRENRFAFINRISVGVAAAVVLICVIGIGYGGGYNNGLEDKMRAMGSLEMTTEENTNDTAESKLPEITTKQIDTTDEAIAQAESTEAATAQTEDIKVVPKAVENREVATEMITESIVTNVQIAANEESVQIEAALETETESVCEESSVAVAKMGRSSIPDDHMDEGEENSNEAVDTQTAFEESAPAVASVQSADETVSYHEAEVNLVVIGTDTDTLISILSEIEDISDVKAEENIITARVDGMSYKSFKELLSDFTVDEEDIYVEESSVNYSISIRVK